MSFHHTNSNINIGDIVDLCSLTIDGLDRNFKLRNFLKPELADVDDLSFVSNSKYAKKTNAKHIITTKNLSTYFDNSHTILISDCLDFDIAKISNLFYRSKTSDEISNLDIFKTGHGLNFSKNSLIKNGVSIGDNFSIDDFSVIGHNCFIGNNVKIGKNVSIENSIIGDNVNIGDGTKIGQSGFGFTYDKKNNPIKIFHIGRVIIQNNVNIKSNCTIDRGSFSDTVIGENTFIDNLVHIAHNVIVGNNCIIAGQSGLAGSSKIGNFVQIGGQVGVSGHIEISDYVKIAAKSGVIRNIKKGDTVMGYPAINLKKYLKIYKKIFMKT